MGLAWPEEEIPLHWTLMHGSDGAERDQASTGTTPQEPSGCAITVEEGKQLGGPLSGKGCGYQETISATWRKTASAGLL